MQHRALTQPHGLRRLHLSSWIRFGTRLMRVVHGTDYTSPANMVAVVTDKTMIYDPDVRNGRWVYGPTSDQAFEDNAEGFIVIDGLRVHQDCLAFCDAYLLAKGVKPLPNLMLKAPSLLAQI